MNRHKFRLWVQPLPIGAHNEEGYTPEQSGSEEDVSQEEASSEEEVSQQGVASVEPVSQEDTSSEGEVIQEAASSDEDAIQGIAGVVAPNDSQQNTHEPVTVPEMWFEPGVIGFHEIPRKPQPFGKGEGPSFIGNRMLLVTGPLEMLRGNMQERFALCFIHDDEVIPIPFHAIVVLVYAKETCGFNFDKCTIVDEYIARIMKNCRGDDNQISKIDFRTVLNAHKVFDLYAHIMKQGGLLAIYPDQQLPRVIDVLEDFTRIIKRWPHWRGLNDDEVQIVGLLKRNWFGFLKDAIKAEADSEADEPRSMEMKSSEVVETDLDAVAESVYAASLLSSLRG